METEMNTGMLWFDNDPKIDFYVKIMRASEYYQKKYGQIPNVCFVHPSMKVEATLQVNRCGCSSQSNDSA